MSRNKLPPLALALALLACVLAPPVAGDKADVPAPQPPAAVTVADPTAPAEAAEPAQAPPAEPQPAQAATRPAGESRKGNAFLRALAAPFRALGRLFGGDSKSSGNAAQQRVETPAEVAAAPQAKTVETPSTPSVPAPAVADVPPAATQPAINIIRPDAQPQPPPSPGRWVPVIEGIGKDPLTQGHALLERGYLKEAIAELSSAAAGTRNLAEANNLLGLAYDRLGDHRQAAEAYERALTATPDDPVLLANLGYSLYLSNNFRGALKRLSQAARLAPQLNVVHDNLGIVHARLGKYDEAFRSFARASGEYDAHIKLARILEFELREEQAIKHYEAALRLQPGATALLERLVALYERTGDRTKAETARRTLGQPKNEQRTTTGGG